MLRRIRHECMTPPLPLIQEAVEMTALVLDGHRRIHGRDHAMTLRTAGNLANRLGDLGRHREAADLHREAWLISL